MKNWKTSVCGILSLVSGLAPIWAPPALAAKIQASAAVFVACGLLAAQDSDKGDSGAK